MYTVYLKRNEEKNILNGFPWIYANEVSKIEGKDIQGSICTVKTFDGAFLAKGYINHASKIIVRILTLKDEDINDAFFYNRIKEANDKRIDLGYSDNYRVVFGESDFLPGLIVDKYGKYLSIQLATLGMDIRKELIIKILIDIFKPLGIYERSDLKVREKEGLKQVKGILYGKFNPKIMIEENGLKLNIDLENGQKTGYFLDQKDNRDNIKYYCKDKTVLDCFCNVGGFSLCASKYKAKEITSVDISASALELVNENAKLNGFDNIKTIEADVFSKLREYKKDNKTFDLIVLDPPAFTKSIDTVKSGYNGYLDINTLALKLLNKNGYLITCSCSEHLTLNLFLKMIKEAITRTNKKAKILEVRFQGKDHAPLLNFEESLYLKVAVIQVL